MNIIERVIGPVPVGDVDAMRRLAAELRTRARDLRHHADRIAGQPSAMVFSGPAADAFRVFVEHERAHLHAIAEELDQQAGALEREAAETAGAQNRWHRLADQVKHEVKLVESAGGRAVDKLDDIRKSIF